MNNEFVKYIFVSHSSKDWKKVRLIRNYLEERDFYPLLFHMKCMEQEPMGREAKEELYSLLRREIKARGRFLYCDSSFAQSSEYVCWEREEVAKLSNILIENIDLNLNQDAIYRKLDIWISKLNKIVFVGTWKSDKLRAALTRRIKENNLNIEIIGLRDDEHIPVWHGCLPPEAIRYIEDQIKKIDESSMVLLFKTEDFYERGFCSRAESYIKAKTNCLKSLAINISDTELEKKETVDYIFELICKNYYI